MRWRVKTRHKTTATFSLFTSPSVAVHPGLFLDNRATEPCLSLAQGVAVTVGGVYTVHRFCDVTHGTPAGAGGKGRGRVEVVDGAGFPRISQHTAVMPQSSAYSWLCCQWWFHSHKIFLFLLKATLGVILSNFQTLIGEVPKRSIV